MHGVEDEDNNEDNNNMKTQRVHQGALIATVVLHMGMGGEEGKGEPDGMGEK